MPLASGWAKPRCVSLEEEYILWKEKSGLMTGEDSWIIIKEDPGDPLKKKLLMAIEELEKELAGAWWLCKLEDKASLTIGELLAEIAEASQKIDANLKRIRERRDEPVKPSTSHSERN